MTRVLMMYTKFCEGGKVHKKSFCMETGIDRRTFDRDIEDIRVFLSEAFLGDELVYDRADESYHLENYQKQKALSDMEMAFLMELLKSSQALRKDEYVGLMQGILDAGERSHKQALDKLAARYTSAYPEGLERAALLKIQWDLQQCIAECDWVCLCFAENRQLCFSPVSLWVYEQDAYVFGYGEEGEMTAYPIHTIESFQMEGRKFDGRLVEAFDSVSWSEKERILKKVRKKHGEDKKD